MRSGVSSLVATAARVRRLFVFPRIVASTTQSGFVSTVLKRTLTSFQAKYNMNSESDREEANNRTESGEESTDKSVDNTTLSGRIPRFQYIKNVDYSQCDKDELINRISNLEQSLKRMEMAYLRSIHGDKETLSEKEKKVKAKPDFFNWFNTRHVAFQVCYLGWDYHGLQCSDDGMLKTIECELYKALLRTKLIESIEAANLTRSGRTDRGVSAFCQVIVLDVRTALIEGLGVKVRDGGAAHERKGNKNKEINYMAMLNGVLPREIRVLAWCPVPPEFNARFDCRNRTYKYYFPEADLKLEAMQEAAKHLLGYHDFRNLCKMDIKAAVTNFQRSISVATIKRLDDGVSASGYAMCEATIASPGFLWHQIRCIMAVLFMIGQGKEKPEVVKELLDVELNPRKPQYGMAADLPLVLHECSYDNLDWQIDEDSYVANQRTLQNLWTEHSVKCRIIKSYIDSLPKPTVSNTTANGSSKEECDSVHEAGDQSNVLDVKVTTTNEQSMEVSSSEITCPETCNQLWMITGKMPRVHRPLLSREKEDTLEEKIEHQVKRRRLQKLEES